MGQAKRRGTYEERAAHAKAIADAKCAERRRHEADVATATAEKEARYLAALTPVQRERYTTRKRDSDMALAILLGAVMGMTRHKR